MKTLLLITASVVALVTTSCNTFIGVGRDMRIAGEGMEKVANKGVAGGGGGDEYGGAPVY